MTRGDVLETGSTRRSRRTVDPELITTLVLPVALVAMIVVFAVSSTTFFTIDNLFVVLRQSAVLGVAAIGATIILISGRLDISQGALIAASGIICVSLAQAGLHPLIAIAGAILLGALLGLVNGVLTEITRIPGFISTLAVALIVRGAAQVWTSGQSIAAPVTEGFDLLSWVGTGSIGPIPVAVILVAILYVVAWFVMRKTTWGLRSYAIGSSGRASRVAGLRVNLHAIQVFVVAGALSAAAGVLLAGRLGSGAASNGQGAEFDIFAAVVLGGTSLFGGRGSIPRTALGIVFLATLSNGLVILNVSSYWQGIATGTVLLLALAIDRWRARDEE
ncbi:ABC transporter permease [Microbacterium sp. K24]|jgi:ribose transport system permease protein|uniref:ABC transporter permease n=1 Tax=Microbacterium sp. K24 TaxID=2305446 RepID=UPI00109D473E|nr:ABC transporter permease [Microbacterium sp. K24]